MEFNLRPHVLAFPFPAQGHINPMMLLCQRLSSMGFIITFLNTKSLHKGNVQGDGEFRYLWIADDCLPKGRLGNNLQLFLNAMEGMREDFKCILEQLMNDPNSNRPPVSFILVDGFLGWTQDVARDLGIPRASLWTSSATWALISLHFPLLRSHGLLPTNGSSEMIDFIPGLPPFSARSLPESMQVADEDDPDFNFRIQKTTILKDDAWVFVNSFNEMEADQIEQLRKEIPNVIPVGPLLPPHLFDQGNLDSKTGHAWASEDWNLWKEDLSCLQWLDNQERRSVVYISFGSLATLSKHEVEEILEGLDRSGHAFLWVIRLDMFENDQVSDRDELLLKMKQNKRGLIISWAPQLQVLQHESVAVFLTHCGWNSTTESVAAGVPMLCRPFFGDQTLNCTIVVDYLKVGLRATEDDGSKEATARWVEETLKVVMTEEGAGIRSRANALKEAALRAVQNGGSSFQNLKGFAQAYNCF